MQSLAAQTQHRLQHRPTVPTVTTARSQFSNNRTSRIQPADVTVMPVESNMDWHPSITTDLRKQLVGQLANVIYSAPDVSAERNSIEFAKRIEAEMYKVASSRQEYYKLLTEKIVETNTGI